MSRISARAVCFLFLVSAWGVSSGANMMTVGGNFWNLAWEGTADFFRSGVNWATETNPWNPALITDCAPYSTLRYMDWCLPRVNDNDGVWANRKKMHESQVSPVAYEWMIDLSNRTNTDMWICVPSKANADYSYQLAQLIFAQLKSPLKVYAEYTNEHWNYDPEWYQQQGAAAGMPGRDAAAKGEAFYVYKSVEVWEQFERVFGKDSPRLVKVMCGNAASAITARTMIAMLDSAKVNPNKVKCNAIGLAPYMRGATVAACRAELYQKYGEARSHYSACNPKGIKVVCYEAGFETSTGATIAADPAVYDLVKSYLDTLSKAGLNGPCNWYTAVGAPSGYQWGAKGTTGQSSSSAHKWRAISDWVAGHPVSVDPRQTLTVARTANAADLRTGTAYGLAGRLVSGSGAAPMADGVWMVKARDGSVRCSFTRPSLAW